MSRLWMAAGAAFVVCYAALAWLPAAIDLAGPFTTDIASTQEADSMEQPRPVRDDERRQHQVRTVSPLPAADQKALIRLFLLIGLARK